MKGFVRHLHKINKGKRKAISEHMLMFEARKFGLKLDLRYIGDGALQLYRQLELQNLHLEVKGKALRMAPKDEGKYTRWFVFEDR